ncbi:helix-turn-helix domain-containing protein [Agitococcus lubricus]|uniref:Xre family transcriptional regulator n=1 Tax=Agitococcus lubricus TaxID=1077255 RepID=A0A2T5ISA5_9GAMM|nr:helix-turn-helix domain-containing protein [Agitococcus lubricus]PTQ86692.1 Xre family transcriptional regulator [Agitococcus lubricus]
MDAEMTKFTEDLLQSVREMKADIRARETKVNISDVIEARHKVGLSQQQFANVLHISKRTLQDWEQGRRQPSGAAQTLIRIALSRPDVIMEVMA